MKNGTHPIAIVIFLVLLITAEIIWSWRQDKKAYGLRDTLANLVILAGFQLSKYLFAGYQLVVVQGAAHYAPVHLPATIWTFAACFILADFIYYWFHRLSHQWQPLWAFHLIHHSSPYINLT